MGPIQIDSWTLTFQPNGHWVAFQPDNLAEHEGPGYNVWIQNDSIYVDEVGRHEDSAFIEVPLKIVKKLLELK